MVTTNVSVCPVCGGELIFYDNVSRIVRTKRRETRRVSIRRMQCHICDAVHRELPDYLLPYKQYESEVIFGVREGLITSDTLGYEDYPCEATMIRWKTRSLHTLL